MTNPTVTAQPPLLDNSVRQLLMRSIPAGTQMLAQVDGYSCSVLIVNPTDGNPYVRIVTPTKDWRVDVEAIDQGVT